MVRRALATHARRGLHISLGRRLHRRLGVALGTRTRDGLRGSDGLEHAGQRGAKPGESVVGGVTDNSAFSNVTSDSAWIVRRTAEAAARCQRARRM